jgi:hypothetical protein
MWESRRDLQCSSFAMRCIATTKATKSRMPDEKSVYRDGSWSSKPTFEVFTRVSPDNSLERLTERSVGLITDQPGDVDELLVTLL